MEEYSGGKDEKNLTVVSDRVRITRNDQKSSKKKKIVVSENSIRKKMKVNDALLCGPNKFRGDKAEWTKKSSWVIRLSILP